MFPHWSQRLTALREVCQYEECGLRGDPAAILYICTQRKIHVHLIGEWSIVTVSYKHKKIIENNKKHYINKSYN